MTGLDVQRTAPRLEQQISSKCRRGHLHPQCLCRLASRQLMGLIRYAAVCRLSRQTKNRLYP